MLINPGTYEATVLNHSIGETKKGDPQAIVTFSFEAQGSPQRLTWYGSFSEKASPHTIKALIVCGLKGNNPAGDLEIGKKVLIVVEIDKDENGREYSKIRWVNALDATRNVIPPDMAKSKLSALEGAVMAARQKMNVRDEDEIPF